MKRRNYSPRTIESYTYWIRFYIRYHNKTHPEQMGAPQVEAFLSYLANERNISASTQNTALSALLFLYRHVLEQDLPWLDAFVRAKRTKRLPVVLSVPEVRKLLDAIELEKPPVPLIVALLYGTGMRIHECLTLRAKDIDFDQNIITIRSGKGDKDRVAILPERLKPALEEWLKHRCEMLREDRRNGVGTTYRPP